MVDQAYVLSTSGQEDNMVSFESDYIAGAHPKVLQRLVDTNQESLSGYGTDKYCSSAKEKIKKACDAPDAEVEFLTGGTQTNMVVISTMLRGNEGVIAAKTGHINCHEAGSVEYSGYKVMEVEQYEGKLKAKDVDALAETFYGDENHEHMVYPKMVYISHPTEYGTLYSKAELEELAAVCKKYSMYLFLDGARLGYGLMSKATDVSLHDIAKLCDVFYIGGTKVGALCGEAIVFKKGLRPEHFVGLIKQRGALVAKGRMLGVQFDALFTDGLYFEIGRYAEEMKEKLRKLFIDRGIRFFIDSPTNQQFVILENSMMEELKKYVAFSFWEKLDADHTVVRFATGWSTTEGDLKVLEDALNKVM